MLKTLWSRVAGWSRVYWRWCVGPSALWTKVLAWTGASFVGLMVLGSALNAAGVESKDEGSQELPSAAIGEPTPSREPSAPTVVASPTLTVAPAAVTSVPSPTATAERPTSTPTASPSPQPPTNTPTPTTQPIPGVQALVIRVIDGDTIEVDRALDGQATIRLIGIDTPETVAPGQPVGCYGPEASSYTKELLEGQTVYLEKDVSETDRFDRLLRYVYLDTGEMVNELLVLNGYGQVSTDPPDVKFQERFLAAQRAAVENNRGLWGGCQAPAPTATEAQVAVAPATTPVPAVIVPTATSQVTSGLDSGPGNCHPSYQGGADRDRGGCIQSGIGDYDCSSGEGNGPNYAVGPVTVVGPDEFGLDNNDPDVIGCEDG